MIRVLTMLVVVSIGASQALAEAIVKQDSGPVLVNKKPIYGSVTAKAGARVSVGNTGYATVYFKNGCSRVVEARQTYIVEDDPVCEEASYYNDYLDKAEGLIVGGVLVGGLAAYILSQDDDGPRPASP